MYIKIIYAIFIIKHVAHRRDYWRKYNDLVYTHCYLHRLQVNTIL